MLACLLLAGVVVGVVEQPYQLLADWGFQLQALWPMHHGRPLDPSLALIPFGGTVLFCLLAWGPLRLGRGGGLTGALALQRPDLPEGAEEVALQGLSIRAQAHRFGLMVATHGAGLTVGTESPSSSLGATAFLWLRERLPPLRALPVPLAAAVGAGAGLGAAFRSPLLGVAYAMEEVAASARLSLVLPCALVGGLGALLHTNLGLPAHFLGAEVERLWPHLWGRALLLTVGAAVLGALFVRAVQAAAGVARRLLERHLAAGAVAAGALLALLAVASGGVSLNDGQLTLVPLLTGTGEVSWAQGASRFLASVVSVALGAPGGVMHDTMTLGAMLSETATGGLGPSAAAALAAVGAVAFFSGATGNPFFCALFVFQLQGDPGMLTPLLFFSALACAVGKRLNPTSWNESQVSRMLSSGR